LGALAIAPSCTRGDAGQVRSDWSTVTPGRRLRRLSRREYNNVVRDLLGDTTRPADSFGLEVYINGYDNGSDGLTVQGTDVDALQAAAEAVAARAVSGNLSALVPGCDPQANAEACLEVFLSSFPKRAFRRPPTAAELLRMRNLYATGAVGGDFGSGIQLVLEGILQSPAFLYREELGAPDPALPSNMVRLTSFELASELSFLITGTMPDDELIAAADASHLRTADDLRREATRLLGTPAAKPLFRAFLHQWLSTVELASLGKSTTIYPSFTPALAASMSQELDDYFDHILWSGSGSYRELLTSTWSSVDPALATLYGSQASGAGFQPVTLDGETRQGVLTRAGYLAVHADADSSGPVARGVFVLDALLCRPPMPPPPDVPRLPPASAAADAHQTTRQRFDKHLSETFCNGCHVTIDGVGFGFEEFDGIGRYRTTENGASVDTSGTLVGTDVDGRFVGASELAARLVTSQDALRCFVRQSYRFAMGQEETDQTKTLIDNLATGFSADARVSDVLLALVSDPAFTIRTTAQGESAR
jgi:hypothetical protein